MPLTYAQLNTLGLPELIMRLIRRKMFFLAHHIASYLDLPAGLGTHKVLLEWASLKLQQQEPDDVMRYIIAQYCQSLLMFIC